MAFGRLVTYVYNILLELVDFFLALEDIFEV